MYVIIFSGTVEDIEEVGPEIQKLREFEASIPPPRDINQTVPHDAQMPSSTTPIQKPDDEGHVILLPSCHIQHLEPNNGGSQ